MERNVDITYFRACFSLRELKEVSEQKRKRKGRSIRCLVFSRCYSLTYRVLESPRRPIRQADAQPACRSAGKLSRAQIIRDCRQWNFAVRLVVVPNLPGSLSFVMAFLRDTSQQNLQWQPSVAVQKM